MRCRRVGGVLGANKGCVKAILCSSTCLSSVLPICTPIYSSCPRIPSPNMLTRCSTYPHARLLFTSPDASPQPVGAVFYPSARLSTLPIPGYLLETCWRGALSIRTPVYAPHPWMTSSPTCCTVFYPFACPCMLPIPRYLLETCWRGVLSIRMPMYFSHLWIPTRNLLARCSTYLHTRVRFPFQGTFPPTSRHPQLAKLTLWVV